MEKSWISREADFPLEAIILLIAGLTLLITGVLLFPVSTGSLSYYENGLYGLILVIFALQITTLGKTPFGDMGRSVPLVAAGVIIAAVGIITCFIPDALSWIPRMLLFVFLGPGSLLLLIQMCLSGEKLRTWIRLGAEFTHLIIGCTAVYLLSMTAALLIIWKSLLTTRATAVVILAYGASVIYLAFVLRTIYGKYPEAEKPAGGDVALSTEQVLVLMMGIFMLLLGWLLIPVNLGMLPFSGSAQLGLLMIFLAIKMLASGDSPVGSFPRSWLVISLGTVMAGLGIVSCIIPDILVLPLTVLIGIFNIAGSAVSLWKLLVPRLKGPKEISAAGLPILEKLFLAQLTLNLLSMMFGISMLIANLIPGLIIGVILALNGCVLLYLLRIIVILDKMRAAAAAGRA